jgi:ATP-dependent helicase Lhr and Lhr-like helicase
MSGAPSFERSLLEGSESTNPARPDPASDTTMGAPGPDSRTWERTNSSQPGEHDFSRADEVSKGTGFSPYIDVEKGEGASAPEGPTTTESAHALALQLLNRYGILLREYVAAENVPGGFSAVYGVLKALEESGRIRRGYFVAGLGATQFALPAAVDLLRQLRTDPPAEKPEFVLLAAADPSNPYGAALPWPDLPAMDDDNESAPRILTRAAYAEVILRNGQLVTWMRRGNPNLLVFLPADEPERAQVASGLAHFLSTRGQAQLHAHSHNGALITTINGQPVAAHPLARFLMDAGFHPGPLGMHLRRIPLPIAQPQAHHPEVQ